MTFQFSFPSTADDAFRDIPRGSSDDARTPKIAAKLKCAFPNDECQSASSDCCALARAQGLCSTRLGRRASPGSYLAARAVPPPKSQNTIAQCAPGSHMRVVGVAASSPLFECYFIIVTAAPFTLVKRSAAFQQCARGAGERKRADDRWTYCCYYVTGRKINA